MEIKFLRLFLLISLFVSKAESVFVRLQNDTNIAIKIAAAQNDYRLIRPHTCHHDIDVDISGNCFHFRTEHDTKNIDIAILPELGPLILFDQEVGLDEGERDSIPLIQHDKKNEISPLLRIYESEDRNQEYINIEYIGHNLKKLLKQHFFDEIIGVVQVQAQGQINPARTQNGNLRPPAQVNNQLLHAPNNQNQNQGDAGGGMCLCLIIICCILAWHGK